MPGAEHAGILRVVDIGFPDDLVRAGAWLTEPEDVRAWPLGATPTRTSAPQGSWSSLRGRAG